MKCHYCRKDFSWLLFGRYCMGCWRKAPSVAALARATREFLHPAPTPGQIASKTHKERWRRYHERKKVESRDVPR